MNFIKALLSWKLWLGILLGLALLVGLWFYTFKFLEDYVQHGVVVEVPDLSGKTIQQAMKILDDNELKYEIDSIRFSEDYPPFTVLEVYPKAGSLVKPGRRVFIKSNPSTWRPVSMPNLLNKSNRIAITQLKNKGFKLGNTIYVDDPAKDVVLGVLYDGDTIQSGQELPKGAVIDLILGRGFNMDMPVPNLIGLNIDEAKVLLKENYFDIGQIYSLDGEVVDSTSLSVIYQDPPNGEAYDEGLPVSFWISAREKEEIKSQMDSLDRIFRKKVSRRDSLFFNSVESSKDISIRDLPEDVKNQVKYDQNVNEEMKPENEPNLKEVDTTGISIE